MGAKVCQVCKNICYEKSIREEQSCRGKWRLREWWSNLRFSRIENKPRPDSYYTRT